MNPYSNTHRKPLGSLMAAAFAATLSLLSACGVATAELAPESESPASNNQELSPAGASAQKIGVHFFVAHPVDQSFTFMLYDADAKPVGRATLAKVEGQLKIGALLGTETFSFNPRLDGKIELARNDVRLVVDQNVTPSGLSEEEMKLALSALTVLNGINEVIEASQVTAGRPDLACIGANNATGEGGIQGGCYYGYSYTYYTCDRYKTYVATPHCKNNHGFNSSVINWSCRVGKTWTGATYAEAWWCCT